MVNYRKPHRLKKRKLIFQNRFFWLGLFILIILGGIFYLIYFYSFFQIKVIEISGNQKISSESLENLLKEKINHPLPFFWQWSSQSIFLANLTEINKEILKNFPQIEEADLKRKFPDKIIVQIKERRPAAVFCPFPEKEEVDCFFIDKQGIIFEKTATKEGFALIKKDIAGKINLGERVTEEEQLSKALATELRLKTDLKILVEEILVFSEVRFDAKTQEGWQIYFNFGEDLDWQLAKLRAVLTEEIPRERRKDLEYIDVRFGNFSPYKYRD